MVMYAVVTYITDCLDKTTFASGFLLTFAFSSNSAASCSKIQPGISDVEL